MFIIIHITATPSLKKQTSVSQHSSISQADDVSSPYSRVKNSPHDYAKVRLIFQNTKQFYYHSLTFKYVIQNCSTNLYFTGTSY